MSEWTIKTLKVYVDSVMRERDARYSQRFVAQELAIQKAEVATEMRFQGVNEFRQTLSDQAVSFIPRSEVHSLLTTLADKVDVNSSRMDRIEGRNTGTASMWTYALAVIAILGTLAGIIGSIVAIVVVFSERAKP